MVAVVPSAPDSSQRRRVLRDHNTSEVRFSYRIRHANMHIYSSRMHITLPFRRGNASEVSALNLHYIPCLTPLSTLASPSHTNAQQKQEDHDRPVTPSGIR